MAVTVYFARAVGTQVAGVELFNKGTFPRGVSFDYFVDYPDQIRVIDSEGKTVGIVSASAMLMIQIDDEDEARKDPDDAAASPSAD